MRSRTSRGGSGAHPFGGLSRWRRAPLALRRYPGIFAAIGASAVVLAAATAGVPLFESSAGNAALHSQLAGLCPWPIGLQVRSVNPLWDMPSSAPDSLGLVGQKDEVVRAAVRSVPHLGGGVFTVIGEGTVAGRRGRQLGGYTVRLLSRDGALDHIKVIASTGGPGVWISDRTAADLRLGPGDAMVLRGSRADRSCCYPPPGMQGPLRTEPGDHVATPPARYAGAPARPHPASGTAWPYPPVFRPLNSR